MAFKVALTNPRPGSTPDLEMEALAPIGAEIVPIYADDQASYAEQLRDVDAVIVGPKVNMTAAVIGELRRCKLIMATGIGLDKIDVDAATAAGIPVTNVPDVFTEEVADQAFTLLLAVNRKLIYCYQMATSGRWSETQAGLGSVPKINGKTLGLVAFGNIARAVARRAKGFGLRVIAHDPFVTPEAMAEHGVESASLEQVFRESDFVSAHAPHSKATHHMIGAAQFGVMKPTAIFVNTGRGKVVDEAALIAALREGKLAGAGLDVLEDEPPAPDNPLLSMPNVVVTPHVAAYSNESVIARRRRHGEEIAAVLTGRRPRNCANKAVLDRLALA
ncbi:MAG: C-terminal binding protein [Chloroflexota bacterium]|nr:C-terminal binding protein [Chloroflexota bacterium]